MLDKNYIRVLLGNINSQQLPDSIIDFMINRYSDVAPEYLQLFKVITDSVKWLIANNISYSNIYTSRTEKIGDEQISFSGGSQVQSWKDFLDYLYENPEYIDPNLNSIGLRVIIGGVRQDRFDEVRRDPNSRGPFQMAFNNINNITGYTYD